MPWFPLAILAAAQAVQQPACSAAAVRLPVRMEGLGPTVAVAINGKPAILVFDTGAGQTMLQPGSESKFGLVPKPRVTGVFTSGGQPFRVAYAHVLSMRIGEVEARDLDLPVVQSGGPTDYDGLLGQDVYADYDLEIDLPAGEVHLWSAGCGEDARPAWTRAAGVNVLDIEVDSAGAPRIFASGRINGVFARVMFDTGFGRSSMSSEAAHRAGVEQTSAGVEAGPGVSGIGQAAPQKSWIARFRSVAIGGETFRDKALEVIVKQNPSADLILGDDYFLTHRVFVARRAGKLYSLPISGDATPPPSP